MVLYVMQTTVSCSDVGYWNALLSHPTLDDEYWHIPVSICFKR